MKILIVIAAALVFASVLAGPPQERGPYNFKHRWTRVGTFKTGGSQYAVLYYPKDYKKLNFTYPVIAFAHGMTVASMQLTERSTSFNMRVTTGRGRQKWLLIFCKGEKFLSFLIFALIDGALNEVERLLFNCGDDVERLVMHYKPTLS